MGNERRYTYKDPRQDSGQMNIPYKRYPKKCFTQIYRNLYADEIALAGEFLTFYEELLPKNSKKYKSLFYIIIQIILILIQCNLVPRSHSVGRGRSGYEITSNDDLNI